MNPVISFNTNATGNFSITPAQRNKAVMDITSMLRAALAAKQRASSAASAADIEKSASAAKAQSNASDKPNVQDSSLSRDAFLQLLVTQMQYQDPMSPMDNTDMIAQLAQFSALEQMTNLNSTFDERFNVLNARINQLNFVSAQGLIGQDITGIDVNGKTISGAVDSVLFDMGETILRVGESYVPVVNLLNIGSEPAGSAASSSSSSANAASQAGASDSDSTAAPDYVDVGAWIPEGGIGQ